VEKDAAEEILTKVKAAEYKAKEEADKKANNIIALAVQRLSQETTAESTVTLVPLASDDLKGRIIGREGRNITAFEMATGVDVIVDDTPGAVLISGFDLVRRYVAKIALEKLVTDGRIHPARIEETVKKAQADVEKMIQEWGEKAVIEAGVVGLHPSVVKLIGRLRFRTSYGQNILKHSLEACFIGGALAAELGADEKLVKKACLLHDIGKAVDHEIEGPHAVIGANILRKFKLPEEIIHAVEAHHEDVAIESLTDIIVQTADAISGSRPGARRESLDAYIKRLEELENIAKSFKGVENSYAIQAGREVRVIVNPAEMDDLAAHKLAKSISDRIEKEMTYPGQIKVNVIRETRAESLAK
jgi:ribonuclease Y